MVQNHASIGLVRTSRSRRLEAEPRSRNTSVLRGFVRCVLLLNFGSENENPIDVDVHDAKAVSP
jgi:hypothetical protein